MTFDPRKKIDSDLTGLARRENFAGDPVLGSLVTPEPPPKESTAPAVWNLVLADMHDRNRMGVEKYGTPLRAFNGRDALKDAYQEALDLAVYLRAALYERDMK